MITVALCAVTILGCAGNVADQAESSYDESSRGTQQPPAVVTAAAVNVSPTGETDSLASTDASGNAVADNRRIIYDTTVGLVVDDYQRFETRLPPLVARYGGFIASSDTDRRYNHRQSGTWVVRIPVASYSDFLIGITAFGFAESIHEDAHDVTEESVDIEARIKNKRKLEARIVALLEERAGKLADILEIERELSRVREEIERMEGRLRFLHDRTSLATVTISVREQKEYQPAEAPTLASRIYSAGAGSLRLLRAAVENIVIALIAMIPWLVVIGMPLLLIRKRLAGHP